MKTILSIFLFFTSLLHLIAQEGAWQHYFPNGNVNAIATSGNIILIATDIGLVHFDTLGNKEYMLPTNSDIPSMDIQQVAIDESGHWWIYYAEGFARFNGTDWQTWSNAEAGVSNTVQFMRAAPGGAIYAGIFSHKVVVFQNGVWTSMDSSNSGLPSNDVRDVAFDQNGKVYFATGAGLAIQDGANWTVYNSANTGFAGFSNTKSVAVTATGIIWVTEGFNRFAKFEAGVWTEYVAPSIGLTGGAGFSGKVLVDDSDRLWLSFSKSMSVLSGGVWTHYLEAEIGCTLLLSSALQLAVDGAGQLWTSWCDLSLFDGQSWTHPATGNSRLPDAVYAITQDAAGNMWFGGAGSKSIAKKDLNGNWESFDPLELGASGTSNEVWSAHGDASGKVWFAMLSGEILSFDGTNWALFNTVAATYDVFDTWFVDSGPDGTLWFSFIANPFSALLARYKNGEWTFFSALEDIPFPTDIAITSIAFTNNITWFYGSGILVKFDGTNWQNVPVPIAPAPSLRKIAAGPDGTLWVSTSTGLFNYDGVNWTNLSTSNSEIPSDNIYSVVFDQVDRMYIGCAPTLTGANCAVSHNGEWMELVPPSFESAFDREPWQTFVDQDNLFWFIAGSPVTTGTPKGVLVYDPMVVDTEEYLALPANFSIFPNPTTGQFTLKMTAAQQEETMLRILNAHGQMVYKALVPATELPAISVDIAHLPAGVYSVIVIQEGVVNTRMVVKG